MGTSNLISVGVTLNDLRRAVQKLASNKIGGGSSPTFGGLTLTSLTANRLISSNSNKILVSSDLYSWVTETSNQVLIADDGDGSITLSTPQNIHTGASPTFAGLTLSSIANENTDVDKFLVDSTGVIKYRTGAEVLSDIGASPTTHRHDTETLEHDAVNSDGGAFSFTTTGLVTFNQSIASANYTASNLLTACATNAGALDFSAASKTLTVENNAIVSQDYSVDATPTFAGLTLSSIANENTDVDKFLVDSSGVIKYRTGAELLSDLELPSTSNGEGASLIGIEDSLSLYTAANVEAALAEVMDQITIITLVADSVTMDVGSAVGSVSDTQTINDGNEYNIDETTGIPNPNFTATFDFSGIVAGHEPNLIELHWSYNGSVAHTIEIQMWNYTGTPQWDTIDNTTIIDTSGVLTFSSIAITGTITDYVSGGAARVRFNHANNGIATHDFIIDYLAIKDDHGIGSGITDHGSLSGLGDDDHTQYHTDARAATWLAANHETTYAHADIASNSTHRGLTSGNPHSVTPTELSLVIGTNTQAWDAGLDSLAGLTYAAASFVKMTGANTFALRTIAETADDLEGTIDHDSLANYVSAQHIDWTGASNNLHTSGTGEFDGSVGIGLTPVANSPLTILSSVTTTGEFAMSMYLQLNETAPLAVATAFYAQIDHYGSGGTTGSITGFSGVVNQRSTSTMVHVKAGYFAIQNLSTGAITNAYTLQVIGPFFSSTGTVGTQYGLYLNAQNHARVTTAYSIYQAGTTDINYFGSPLSMVERAASLGDVAGRGQLWVKNTNPCELWFTDDLGNDTKIV